MVETMITGDSDMIRAWKEGSNGYVPHFEGLTLGVEMSDPATSESNLKMLLLSGRRVCAMHVGEGGNVLVVFNTGETYLATGFSIGSGEGGMSNPGRYLAKFCSQVWGGKAVEWFDFLISAYGDDYRGEIEPDLLPRGTGPAIFNADDDDNDDSEDDIDADHR